MFRCSTTTSITGTCFGCNLKHPFTREYNSPSWKSLSITGMLLKTDTAVQAIEGLSRSTDQYEEAIGSLKRRYDRPHLIHQAHVRTILKASFVKERIGTNLRRLIDIINQHLRALIATKQDIIKSFIISLLELN